MIRKYHKHTLQTKTRPDIIIHFIKQLDQFRFERKSYAQKCMPVTVIFVANVVVQHGFCFVVCCVETTHYKRKVPSYLLVYDARFSVCNEVQSQDIIIRHLVTSPFKLMYFQIFWQKLLAQNNRSYNREKSTK